MNKCCKKKIIEYLEKARGQKNKLRSWKSCASYLGTIQ
jgi:hypothetical protein